MVATTDNVRGLAVLIPDDGEGLGEQTRYASRGHSAVQTSHTLRTSALCAEPSVPLVPKKLERMKLATRIAASTSCGPSTVDDIALSVPVAAPKRWNGNASYRTQACWPGSMKPIARDLSGYRRAGRRDGYRDALRIDRLTGRNLHRADDSGRRRGNRETVLAGVGLAVATRSGDEVEDLPALLHDLQRALDDQAARFAD